MKYIVITSEEPSASWAIDSEPIRARGIIVKYTTANRQFYFVVTTDTSFEF